MFSYHGGLVWLDWVNTQKMVDGQVRELIPNWAALLIWLEGAGIYTPAELQTLAAATPARAATLLAEGHALRQRLRRLAESAANAPQWPSALVTELDELLSQQPAVLRLQYHGGAPVLRWQPLALPDGLFWPILASVADCLATGSPARLRKCENHACIQFFYDTSKAGLRRWCRMDECGNREKARRHHARARRSPPAP